MIRQNRRGFALSGALLGLAVLSFSDTARAQSVTASTNVLNFTVSAGGIATGCNGNSTCVVQITGNNVSTAQIQTSAAWIKVNPSFAIPSLPGSLSVSVDASTLNAGGTTGTITVYSPTNSAINTVITVNATVTAGSSVLSATPTSLTFQGQVGAINGTPVNCASQSGPASCQIAISTSGPQLTYNISWSTTDGHDWLHPDRGSGQTGGPAVNVSVNPSAVPGAGTYTGSILFQSTTTPDAVAVSVSMTVGANPTLSVSPSSLSYFYTTGGTAPASQPLTIAASSGTLSFSVSQSAGSSWLVVPTLNGSVTSGSPTTINVGVSPTSPVTLTPGKYTATITITPVGGGTAPPPVNVTLIVSSSPFLTVNKTQLTFGAPFGGGTTPASQTVTVGTTNSGAVAQTFNVATQSDSNWMQVPTTSGVVGQPSGTLSVNVNPSVLQSLAVGTYNGTITISPTNGDQYTLTVAATLTVTSASTLTAAPQSLYFSYQIGQTAPAGQIVTLAAAGPAVGFSVATTVSGANPTGCGTAAWLTAIPQTSPLTTPNILSVGVNTAGMSLTGSTPITCQGTVTVTYASGSGNTQLSIPVSVFVSNNALLNVSVPQGFGIESDTIGGPAIVRQIALTSTDNTTAIGYSVSYNSPPCGWLSANPATGGLSSTTPTPLLVRIDPTCITTPGAYQGAVTITSSSLPQSITLPITLTVNSNVQISVSPQSLTFTQAQGAPLPAPQTLNFTVSGGPTNFIASAATDLGNWLQVNPTSGSTSVGSVQVSILANSLPISSTPYNGTITLTFPNTSTGTIRIPVKYTVTQPQTVSVTPTSMTFAYQISGSAPASQQLNVSSTGGAVNFTVGTTSNGGWLGVDTTSSTTPTNGNPKVVNVTIDPTKLPSGTVAGNSLQGTITIAAPSVLTTPTTVNVTLNITAAPVPSPTTVATSAVSNGFGAIVPGELIAIKGTNLGPASPASGTVFKVNAQGGVDATLAGVQVTFDGTPGTPTFVSATQINVIVPWEIAGRTTTNMVISYNGGNSTPLPLAVATYAPGIYTQNATGTGQSAAVNLSSSAASPYNGPLGTTYPGTALALAPAPQGSYVSFYLTGCGPTAPNSTTGTVNPASAVPLRNWSPGSSFVTATIGGQPATVQYAGAAPTLITGICQVNLQVPQGVSGNALPVKITINGIDTLGSATIAVQ